VIASGAREDRRLSVLVGKMVAQYCPSVSGCRAVVEFKDVTDMQTIDVSDDQLRLSFNSSHDAVWLVLA